MYPSPSYQIDSAPEWSISAPMDETALEVERPMTLWRAVVEVQFYILLFINSYGQRVGLNQIPLLSGGTIAISGITCILIMFLTGERLTITLWMCIAIFVGANLSQVFGNSELPIIGAGISHMTFLTGIQAISYYACLNRAASRRLLLALVGVSLSLVLGSGQSFVAGKTKRLSVDEFANFLANPNGVAYVAGFCCVALLFWSLRSSKALRPVLWACAGAMAVLTIQSISRTGIVILGFGLMMLFISVLGARGARVGGMVVLGVIAICAVQFAATFAESFDLLGRRFSGERKNTESRTNLYDLQTLSDLMSTIPFGRGPEKAILTSTGINAHNTFVHNWMAFGAITALPIIIWQVVLGLRVTRLLLATDFPLDIRIMVFTFYAMILANYLTNNFAFLDISSLYGTALIDKYTVPYSRNAINRRMQLAAYADNPYEQDPALPTYSY